MQQREKEKLRQSLRHQNLDLATSSVVFYVLTNITSHIIFFVVLLLATPSQLAHSLGCSHIIYTSRSPTLISSFCSTSPATHCYSIHLHRLYFSQYSLLVHCSLYSQVSFSFDDRIYICNPLYNIR